MEALHDVVRAGKARYLGASSMFAWQFAKAQHVAETHGWTKFVSMQNHYNLLYREEEREMNPLCLDQGVGLIPWSPLARGSLARPPSADATKRSETDRFGKMLYDQTGEADGRIIDAGSARWRTSARCPTPRWRWRGSSSGPGWPRPSSAPPSSGPRRGRRRRGLRPHRG